MAQVFHQEPVPIIFAAVQGIQQLQSGGINLLSIFDRLTVHRGPDGTPPATVTIQVVTMWTGGQGDFTQVLRLLDEDGNQVWESAQPFTLRNTSHRHLIVALVGFEVREGIHTLTVSRSELELSRQDFTIAVAPFPGTQS